MRIVSVVLGPGLSSEKFGDSEAEMIGFDITLIYSSHRNGCREFSSIDITVKFL